MFLCAGPGGGGGGGGKEGQLQPALHPGNHGNTGEQCCGVRVCSIYWFLFVYLFLIYNSWIPESKGSTVNVFTVRYLREGSTRFRDPKT